MGPDKQRCVEVRVLETLRKRQSSEKGRGGGGGFQSKVVYSRKDGTFGCRTNLKNYKINVVRRRIFRNFWDALKGNGYRIKFEEVDYKVQDINEIGPNTFMKFRRMLSL